MTTSIDDAELRYLTYSRSYLYDRTIDTVRLERECPLDQTSCEKPSISSLQNATASIGRLEQPAEIIEHILSNVDLASLMLLRSISRRLHFLIDCLVPYKMILANAPNALRALLSTGAANYFTILDLYGALRAQDCFLCNRFGAFLYLLECRRCCWHCLTHVKDLLPVFKEAAQSLYHLDIPTMSNIPTIINIPGSYGPKNRRMPHMRSKGGVRISMVAFGTAREARDESQDLTAEPRSLTAESRILTDEYNIAKLETRIAFRGAVTQDFMRDMDCMNYDPVGYNEGYGLEPQRFMAAVRFPTLSAAGKDVEWGVSCLGCLLAAEVGEEEKLSNEQFTKQGMVEHLTRCEKAGRYWVGDRVEELNKRVGEE